MMLHPTIQNKAESSACSAMFLWDGMMQSDFNKVLLAWSKGCVELAIELSKDAVLLAHIADEASRLAFLDFPGVYDYEVSESIGKQIGGLIVANGDVPTWEQRREMIGEKVVNFFTQGDLEFEEKLAIETFVKELVK